MRMQKDGVTFEELEELAAKVNFPLNSDEDYIKLFKVAKDLGFWPELDRPKLNTKNFWVPPTPDMMRYRPNPFPDPDHSASDKAKSGARKKDLIAELEEIELRIAELESQINKEEP